MGLDDTICFGPYIIEHPSPRGFPGFRNTGIAIEFTSANAGNVSPIYQQVWEHPKDISTNDVAPFGIGDFYIHQNTLPCDVSAPGYFTKEVASGLLLPVEYLLLSISSKFATARAPWVVLEELREKLGPATPSKLPVPNLLLRELEAFGFRVQYVFPYGRTLSVSISWAPPADKDRGSFCSVGLGYIEFKPERDRTLGKGAWVQMRVENLGTLLRRELHKIKKGPPIKFFSEEGVASLVAAYPWKPFVLLPRKELDAAKLNFIREHPELHSNISALAKALVQQGFYSDSGDRTSAKKFALKALDNLNKEN